MFLLSVNRLYTSSKLFCQRAMWFLSQSVSSNFVTLFRTWNINHPLMQYWDFSPPNVYFTEDHAFLLHSHPENEQTRD